MSNRSNPGETDGQRATRIHEIVNDCLLRRSRGEVVTDHSIIEAHADLMPELAERLRSLHLIQEAERQFLQPSAGGLRIRCPFCHNPMEIVEEASLSDVVCPSCGRHSNLVEAADGTFQASGLQQINHLQLLDKLGVGASAVADDELSGATLDSPGDPDESLVGASPDVESSDHSGRIGRYRIEKVLGKGGFGLVYLAHDEQLDRPVAVKVPHNRLISRPKDAEAYRVEARTVANLDHPNIVPVHDVGSTDQCPCFVVSKYIEGNDLSKKLKRHRLKPTEAAQLVATVAEALHYAHKQGIVHRDVKPGNILIGKDGKPYVVDFGLALREENIGKGPKYAGTPAYMSPEQARGEGHRVDGRSDIYSLGAVFYELLTGRRTFSTDTQTELLEQIASQEVKPPRQIDDAVPKELERICLKALSKRATERHTTALDMAEDLRHFLEQQPACSTAATASPESAPPSDSDSTAVLADADTAKADSDRQPIRIVPKGLRSFDEHDADFFLELLPGPRDREELPDSIRFWKTRIEQTDADRTFSVGLIYGPSGCGKSSLVKAGLLPRLSDAVFPVYVEATPEETETRLLRGLRKRCPAMEDNLSLKETLAALRQGEGIPVGKKILIVLDQFEQWLHAEKGEENTDLVQALRQCDGSRVQCLVLVRDDFWMAATRFMRELEIRLVEAENSAAVDLFSVRFAEKVLAAFGRAFGVLPDRIGETSQDQKAFLQQSVVGLAGEGKVICVRLALFAEMMKGKTWTPATLKEVGGTKGVGLTFLEETFSASTAPPEHRYHQKAARAVLKALLPEFGTDIKGEMKSYDQLLEASGYARRPQDFENLIKILDSEIRLITPTDPEGLESDDDFASHAEVGQKYYQLTHDYLVHSLREWLNRKQRETRRGRAELRLAERAALWKAKPDNRHLPVWWEYGNIRLLTCRQNWTEPQQEMMAKAGRIHGIRWVSALLIALVIGVTIQQMVSAARHRNLSEQVQTTVAALNTSRGIILPPLKDLEEFPREMVLSELREQYENAKERRKLPLAYALAHYDDVRIEFLVGQVEQASPDEVDNILAALDKSDPEAVAALEAAASTAESEKKWRYKARLAILALHLNAPSLAKGMCQLGPDPIQRTWFIEEYSTWHEDLIKLSKLGRSMNDCAFLSGLCMAIGSIGADRTTEKVKAVWQPILTNLHETNPDTGVHSAAGWALRTWGVMQVDTQTPLPEVDLPEASQQQLDMLAANVRRIEQEIGKLDKVIAVRQTTWEAEVRAAPRITNSGLKKGLVADYPLDEQAGTGIANAVAGRSGGVYQGSGPPQWEPRVVNGAFRLDGSGAHVDCGSNFHPERNDEFSYGGWFLTNTDGAMALVAKLDTKQEDCRGFDVLLYHGVVEVYIRHSRPANGIIVTAGRRLADGRWHHVFVSYDGSEKAAGVTVYLDGVAAESTVVVDNLTKPIQNSVPLNIGRRSDSEFFPGVIDDVRIYDRRLGASEVQALVMADIEWLTRIPSDQRSAVQEQLVTQHYRSCDEAGAKLKALLATATAQLTETRRETWRTAWRAVRNWHVNSVGMTMLRIPAGHFVRKDRRSGPTEQTVTLTRSFLLADREVTWPQFQQFIDDPDYPNAEKPKEGRGHDAAGQEPVHGVSWYDAVLFCNWLSEREALMPCYERTGEKEKISNQEYDAWRVMPDANGYRLPTEAEWEYACRAGTVTTYSHGDNKSLLGRYAVLMSEQTELAGSKLPNGWGLFDMHGNVSEWCQDWYEPYGKEDVTDPQVNATKDARRVLRGGSFYLGAQDVRSVYRNHNQPDFRSVFNGFRVARTLTP